MNVALYARMSTDKQENSVENQIQVLTAYANRNQMNLVKLYVDEGISGRNAQKRPAFLAMIEESYSGNFSAVLIYDSSRFARNLKESLIYKAILKENKVELVSITEPQLDDETSILSDALLGAMNELYSLKLAKNVKRGMLHAAQKGIYQCSPPFGYAIPTKKQVPIVIQSESEIVKLIFNLAIEQNSPFQIARTLNHLGLSTRKGNLWECRLVERILKNPIYKGDLVWNKTSNNSRKSNVQADWIFAKGRHESIVSEDIFMNAQKIFTTSIKQKNRKPQGTYKHWLSGIMKCSNCGRSLTYSYSKKGNSYSNFGCSGYKKGVCNVSNNLNQRKAEYAVFEFLSTYLKEDCKIILSPVSKRNLVSDINLPLHIELQKTNDKLQRIKAAYVNGIDSIDEYKKEKNTLQAKKYAIEKSIENHKSISEPNVCTNIFKFKNTEEFLLCESISTESKSVFVKALIDKIVYCRLSSDFKIFMR